MWTVQSLGADDATPIIEALREIPIAQMQKDSLVQLVNERVSPEGASIANATGNARQVQYHMHHYLTEKIWKAILQGREDVVLWAVAGLIVRLGGLRLDERSKSRCISSGTPGRRKNVVSSTFSRRSATHS